MFPFQQKFFSGHQYLGFQWKSMIGWRCYSLLECCQSQQTKGALGSVDQGRPEERSMLCQNRCGKRSIMDIRVRTSRTRV